MKSFLQQALKRKKWQPCTKLTERCEFWVWEKDYLRPECCTDHLKELLFFTEELLTKHGIFHWLDFGSLLGAIRNQEMILWDTDVDFGFLKADIEQVLALKQEIEMECYYFDTNDKNVLRICYSQINTQHVDLFPWGEENEYLKSNWLKEKAEKFYFPSQFISELKPVILYDKSFPAPSPIDDFLSTYRYGIGYMTPQRFVLSSIPEIAPEEFTPIVEELLDEIRERDYYIQELENHILIKRFWKWYNHSESILARIIRTSYQSTKNQLLKPIRAYKFKKNLKLLNDVLATTELSDKYFLWGGLLLGWAREGRILPWDTDADFFYSSKDRDKFLISIDCLIQAGFKLKERFINNEGRITEYVFFKDDIKFEFFEFDKQEDTLHYWLYAPDLALEMVGILPWNGEMATIYFLGRTWLKPDDHDTFLTANYGDWRTPNPDYDYVEDEKSIIAKYEWHGKIIE